MNNQQEYILCSAIKRISPRVCCIIYPNHQDIYGIELGWRHPDILHRFKGEVSINPRDQGFYTSKGRYVNREDGLIIARKANQVDRIIGSILTSEDLW